MVAETLMHDGKNFQQWDANKLSLFIFTFQVCQETGFSVSSCVPEDIWIYIYDKSKIRLLQCETT